MNPYAGLNCFDLAKLRSELKPLRLHWFPHLRSTNDHAAIMRRRSELFAPALVLTGRQTAGRGRGSNRWFSLGVQGGSLTATFAFPVEEHLSPHQIPLVAGLAVRDAASELSNDDSIALKWPNDVLHEGRKLAGLLCERMNKVDLIGVGVNVNLDPRKAPAALRPQITSLISIAHQPIDMTDALIGIARHITAAMSRRRERLFAETLQRYDKHHALIGKKVTVIEAGTNQPITGHCAGIDSRGRLIVRDRKKSHAIIAGEVRAR